MSVDKKEQNVDKREDTKDEKRGKHEPLVIMIDKSRLIVEDEHENGNDRRGDADAE